MATDFFGSSIQADASQTLYHVNAKYHAYGNNCNPGHMALLNSAAGPVGHEGLLGSPVQHHHQHQFMEFSIPQALTQMPVSNESHSSFVSNTNMRYQSTPANLFGTGANSRQYGWVVDNEFSFHPGGNMPESNQPLARGVTAVVSRQQSTSDLCHYGVEGLPPSLVQQQAQLISKIVTPESNNMNRLQNALSSVGQNLSLSLSPQPSMLMQSQTLQQTESAVTSCQGLSNTDNENLNREESFSNRCVGGQNYSMIEGAGCLNHLVSECSIKQADAWSHQSIIGQFGSRYLKAIQELLNEVVNVGRGMKSSLMKQTKPQAWIGPGSISDDSLEKSGPPSQFSSKDGNNVVYSNTGKENDPGVAVLTTSTAGSAKANAGRPVDLTPAESQELQTKKAKLLAMRDEVDQRYKQYHYRMQAAVGAFESAVGFGTARTYTALALETTSKHFRCLRDAINGQIRVTSKSLGEEEISGQGISKLRIVDQQLRQQRALRQLGTIQQHAWRPQRGLPEHSVSILRAWLFEHFLHPYPKDADKIMLARQTKLSRSQVSNWFINARVRLWKPMIEDLYLEELKGRDSEGLDKSAKDRGPNNGSAGLIDNMENNKPVDVKTEESFVTDGQGRDLGVYSSESFLSREDESGQQRSKRPRTEAEGLSTLPPADNMVGVKFESEDIKQDEQRDDDPHGTSLDDPESQNFVSYEQFQLGAYSQVGSTTYSATSYPGAGGVSLTLGLQHCDVLSGTQHHYGQLQLQVPPGTQQGHPADYFSTNERNYLQNQKQIFSHLLRHDFAT